MQEVSKDIFYQLVSAFRWIPYTQTLAYNLSIVAESTLHFYIDDTDCPSIGLVGYERRKAGLRMLCVNGECLLSLQTDRKKYSAFYKAIQETGFDICELNISTPYTANAEIAMRTAGWLRPVGLFSTTLSKIIPTASAATYDRSWKHNLKKAHQAPVSLHITENFDRETIQAYMTCHQEHTMRKGYRDPLSESGLAELGKDSHFKMAYVTNSGGKMIAGHIFYMHPLASSSMYAFTTMEGRETGAAYLLYEGITAYLAENKVDTFDAGRLSPAAHSKNNIFLFKDGIGGDYVQYLGEWLWCRRRWMPLALYFLKKHIWKRVQV